MQQALEQPEGWGFERWTFAKSHLSNMRDNISTCNIDCPLHPRHGYATRVVPGFGSPAAKIMLVGEAPGEDEDKQGYPFVGKSGKLISALLEDIPIPRSSLYITNLVRCRPPGNRDPVYVEITNCGGWFDLEMDFIKPLVVVAVGRFAKERLIPASPKITQSHGLVYKRWESEIKDGKDISMIERSYMSIYHPSYIKRRGGVNSEEYNETLADLENLIELAYDANKGWTK
jgi:DNA polymerase